MCSKHLGPTVQQLEEWVEEGAVLLWQRYLCFRWINTLSKKRDRQMDRYPPKDTLSESGRDRWIDRYPKIIDR